MAKKNKKSYEEQLDKLFEYLKAETEDKVLVGKNKEKEIKTFIEKKFTKTGEKVLVFKEFDELTVRIKLQNGISVYILNELQDSFNKVNKKLKELRTF